MRVFAGLAAIAIGFVCLSTARAGFRDDMVDCRQFAQSDPDKAIRACGYAIAMAERNPELLNERNRADLWFNKALAYEAKRDHPAAIRALDSAISVDAADARFPYRRARLWQASGDCGKAVADHGLAIQILLNPRPGYSTDKSMLFRSYLDRGACHEKMGNRGDALKDYDLALAVFPGAEPAVAALARLDVPQPIPAAAAAPQQPPRTPGPALLKRVALIIGNTDYLYTNRLPNAVRDAEDVAAALKLKGYAIYGYPKVNMTREDMFAALDEFSRAAAEADTALVWYAGHGQEMNDPGEAARNWLFPVDFKGGSDLARGAVPLSKLLSAAQPAKTLRVVVVDACRNTTLQTVSRNARGFRPERRDGMVVVYSTKEGELANDGDPNVRNSPFASAFLEALKVDGANDVRLFFGGVSEGVRQRTLNLAVPQQPELMSNLNTNKTLALAP